MPTENRSSWFRITVTLLLVALVAIGVASLKATLSPRTGRFLPLSGNPYLLLDTATGTECLRVPKSRAWEMTNWLVLTDRDKDVHDSYTAAIEAYGGLEKSYTEEYKNSHQPAADRTSEKNPAWLNDVLKETAEAGKVTSEAEKVASERARKEFDALTRLLHSTDSIPVCSSK